MERSQDSGRQMRENSQAVRGVTREVTRRAGASADDTFISVAKVYERGDASRSGVHRASQAAPERSARVSEVLIVDPSAEWAKLLAQSFEEQGYIAHCQVTLAGGLHAIENGSPSLVCSEINFAPGEWQVLLALLRQRRLGARFVLISNFMTAAMAFGALCQGADCVLTKPALAQDVVFGLGNMLGTNANRTESPVTLSLEAAKTIYLANTVSECGSLAEAGRELSVERRSLRRMLSRALSERARLANRAEPRPGATRWTIAARSRS